MSTSPERPLVTDFAALRRMIEGSTDLLARHSPDGTCLYVSEACRHVLGYAPEELVGTNAYDMIHPDDLSELLERQAAAADTTGQAQPQLVVFRIQDAQGQYRWLETTGRAVFDGGVPIEFQTSSRDVTERMRAQSQLRESESRFRLAMANAPIGMALVGLDGSFLEVNESLCGIVERSHDELVTLTFQDITHAEDLDEDLTNAARLLAGDITSYEMEKRYLLPAGEDVWVLLSGSLVHDERGEPLYFIAQVVNIDERRRAQIELQRANAELERTNCDLARSNAELERFAAVASHDLRSPLATIYGFLARLKEQYATSFDEQGRTVVELAQRVTRQMAESVEGLLLLASVGVEDLELQELDLGSVLTDVREALGPAIEECGATLRIGDLPVIRGDRAQVRLLFQNLLDNAIRFREPARRLVVDVEAAREPSQWRIAVVDNGRGLLVDDAERIFEPSTRVRRDVGPEGAGIGLATCRRIVERHGGTIRAIPRQAGTRFEFTLPAPEAQDR